MTYREPAPTAARPLASSSSSDPGAWRVAPPGRLLAALALVALIGTGCANAPAATGSGGGEKPATEGSPTGDGGDQNGPAGAAPSPAEMQEALKKLPEYAKCMRENGVEDFPDPGPDGTVQYQGDSDQPEFKSAGEKCNDILAADRGREPGNGG
jgi:hypothetical protein